MDDLVPVSRPEDDILYREDFPKGVGEKCEEGIGYIGRYKEVVRIVMRAGIRHTAN
jgi:hypothetical protein